MDNNKWPERPEHLRGKGIAVDGDFYNPRDFPPREYRELRNIIRLMTGHADITDVETDERVGDHDIFPAMIYIVRKREDPKYKLKDAEDVVPADWIRMEREAIDDHPAAAADAEAEPGNA